MVTGSTDGVGKLVAKRLAAAGARVLLHGRNAEKGEAVLAEIRRESPKAEFAFYRADLASLDEVRVLAAEVLANQARLDVLINNAGIGTRRKDETGRSLSRDGHELRFAVNYLSHFLLTELLLPLLKRSAPARIVNVASAGQQPIDFDDVMLERGYDGVRAYRQSKLAQILFTFELAERLKGSGVTANSLHPATFMNTRMVIESGTRPISSVEEGADAILNLAIGPEMNGRSGLYFNGMRQARPDAQAEDPDARRKLWSLSERLTGLR
jgi:NAD(P)-dependent dehydrogenase (short-subunit alcohol dehydrogenase family)